MKKQFVIIGIIVIFLNVGLSGCNETSNKTTENNNKVELIGYNIEECSPSSNNICKNVNITVKNIGTELIKKLVITTNFYDFNNNYIDFLEVTIQDIPESYIKSTSFLVCKIFIEYYDIIDWDNLKFEFKRIEL